MKSLKHWKHSGLQGKQHDRLVLNASWGHTPLVGWFQGTALHGSCWYLSESFGWQRCTACQIHVIADNVSWFFCRVSANKNKTCTHTHTHSHSQIETTTLKHILAPVLVVAETSVEDFGDVPQNDPGLMNMVDGQVGKLPEASKVDSSGHPCRRARAEKAKQGKASTNQPKLHVHLP